MIIEKCIHNTYEIWLWPKDWVNVWGDRVGVEMAVRPNFLMVVFNPGCLVWFVFLCFNLMLYLVNGLESTGLGGYVKSN